jgi:hypothetical protein
MKKVTLMVMGACFAVMAALAGPRLVPLTTQEMARYGATDAVVIEAKSFGQSVAGAAETNTITLTGPCAWEWRGYALDAPFDASSVTGLMTCALTVSIGSQALVSAVQVAADQTRTYKAIVPTALSIAMSGLDATNTIAAAGTWPYAGTLTAGSTATITILAGAPGSLHTLNKVDTGQARLFFRILR